MAHLTTVFAIKLRPMLAVAAFTTGMMACEKPSGGNSSIVTANAPSAATLTALGKTIFFDSTLSASGRTSCASCHDPRHGWAAPNSLAVQLGGADGTAAGVRAVPTLGYAQDTPPFTEHFREDDGNDSEDQGPTGGLMWDGRAMSLHEQASLPLLSAFEMANANRSAVLTRLHASLSSQAFRAAFGEHVFEDSVSAWKGLLSALEVFQQDPNAFYPYSSKYDAVLRDEAELSAQERHGLELFNDPAKGNCASCHPSARIRGAFPQFTDRGFIALGVPRNTQLAVNADTTYFDLGLCGPYRTDVADHKAYCGAFKTPTLRNVARRQVFFHNGVFNSLQQVLHFYAQRDVRPQQFYKTDPRGAIHKYDDLPAAYWPNVNVDAPFDRHKGQRPAFSDAEAADIIAFLRALNDGYAPQRAAEVKH